MTKPSRKTLDNFVTPNLETPFSVQEVIRRIQQAQQRRISEDINMKVNEIMNNVQRIINRYTVGENIYSGRKISITEHKRRRNTFLEKIVNCIKSAEVKEKTLVSILAWLEEWNILLSEMTAIDIEEYHHCVAQMEILPETFKAIEGNVTILTGISKSLIEEKRKYKRKITIRGTLWKPWKEKVLKRPAAAHALRPDQMISDEFATSIKVSEIHDMLQELIGTAMFSKLENNAIKYISSTISNLSKAISILNDEAKGVHIQSDHVYVEEEGEKEKDLVLKIIKDLSENNEILQQKLQIAEEKYEKLIQSKGTTEHKITSGSDVSRADKKEIIEINLVKKLENIDEARRRGTIKWDTAFPYSSTDEMAPDLTEQQSTLQKTSPHAITEHSTEDTILLKKGDVFDKEGADELQSQKKKQSRGLYVHETFGPKGELKDSGTKFDHLEFPSLEKKRKETKSYSEDKSKFPESKSKSFPDEIFSIDVPSYTKGEAGKTTSSLWERLKTTKLEHQRDKSQVSSEKKEEFTSESMDRERKSGMSSQEGPLRSFQLDSSPEKEKIKGKKFQVSPGTSTGREEKTEEKDLSGLTKKAKSPELRKLQSRKLKEASEYTSVIRSPEGKSEQSSIEEFQKAIMTFLTEKIDNIGKPLDKKSVPKKELLKKAEFENLGVIKTKMEEYFQKVAETVTEVLKKYKDMKKPEQMKKPMKGKKEVSQKPEVHFQKPISEKSGIRTLLSPLENMDPVAGNLIQTILTQIESELDVTVASTGERDQKKKQGQDYLQEDQKQKIDISLKSQLQEERNLWGKSHEMLKKNLELEDAWFQMKEGKQKQQKQKQWQEKELGKEQKERTQKQTEQDENQKHREKDGEQHQKSEQQLEAWKQKRQEDGGLLEKVQQMRRIQKKTKYMDKDSSWEKLEEEQKSKRKVDDRERVKQKEAMDQVKIKERKSESQDTVSQISSFPSGATTTYGQNISLTPEQAQALGVILTPEQAQALGITLILQQAQAQEVSLTPQEVKAQEITLTTEEAQSQEITLLPQQAQAQESTLIPQQAQAPGITVSPQQPQRITLAPQQVVVQPQGITLIPEQAQGVTLSSQQAQGITFTPQQTKDQRIILTSQQAQALGITLTPQQTEDQGITLTPQQTKDQGVTLTPQQAQALGITLTPQQAQAPEITLTPQQAQTLGIILIPQQTKALGITVTPQHTEDQAITLTPEHAQALGITVTPQQTKDQKITLTPQQAQALGFTLIPQQAQAQGVTLSPQQAEDKGVQGPVVALTPQQVQTQGITLTPQQGQALGIPFSSHQVQKLGVSLTPEGAPTLRVTVTPQQAQTQGIADSSEQFKPTVITHIPEQVQTRGPPLTSELTQSLEVSLFPKQLVQDLFIREQAQEPVFTLTSEKAEALGVTLSHEQAQAKEEAQHTLTPEHTQALKVPFILDQAQALQTPLTLEQARKLGAPITPEVVREASSTLTSKQMQALRPPLIPKAPLVPGQSLISGVRPASEQIPGLWSSLSPKQPFVPEISSIAEELLESETLALSEQPQTFQPSVTSEQSPSLQPSSTLGQHQLPWTLSGQASPLWSPPIPGHAPIIWAPTPPGKLQKGLSSNIPKRSKRLAISSLKYKSALVQPIASKFKAPEVPSITKKFPISEVSDTPVETQRFPDPFNMEQFKTLQSYVTSCRIPISQTPYVDETRPTLRKPVTSLPSLTTQLSQTSQISPSELDQKPRFPPIDKPWILTSVLGTKKPKVTVPPSSPQEVAEQRYFVDVEAQRKNLILLNEAVKASGLSSQLYTTAENLIIETLHTDTIRLGYIFNKYITYRLIQRARNNIIKRIQAIQNTGKGYETQNLYVMLSRIDAYQKKMMHTWTTRQTALEQKRNQCLRKMIHLFSKLQEIYHLNLSQPIPLIIDKKQVPASIKFVQQPFLQLLIEEDRKSDIFKRFRKEDQMEAIWNADLSTSSYPITEKTAIHSLWAQLGGYPDIPMLLQLDVQSTFRKSLASIQSQ
ncbi:PREDICTED: protein FAM186A [Condylura cristata]|uniref:protein FAM186A n=1 Tax=Condylura cristata TaxID=143302 RepID=UPI0006437D2D|nr:PREDICTED: protein FAM186A [Condylura cristata]